MQHTLMPPALFKAIEKNVPATDVGDEIRGSRKEPCCVVLEYIFHSSTPLHNSI